MTNNRKIRLGMVGGGEGSFIGAVHRIASRIDDHYELVAGALSSDAERSARSALELGIDASRSYASFADMAAKEKAREDGIDVVSIVTPNHMHFPVAKAFIEQGFPVICDKPLCLSVSEAVELESLISDTGGFFGLTHNYTGYPLVRHARHLVQTGALGKIQIIQVEYAQDWLSRKVEDSDNKQAQWRCDPKRSGPAGCLGDIGTHAFNLASFISGLKTTEVLADLETFVEGRLLDDNVHVLLRYENGAKGMLWSSQVAPGNENALKIRIYGENAGLSWAQENPNELWYTPFGEPAQRITRAGPGLSEAAMRASRTPPGHPEGYLEGFANVYTDIAEVLRLRERGDDIGAELQLIPGIEDGVAGMKFITAVLDSSGLNGRWVPLNV